MTGTLRCGGCGRRYAIDQGVPRLWEPDLDSTRAVKARTASSYGYLWSRTLAPAAHDGVVSYHHERMERFLSLTPARGFVLDAGCGNGIDLVYQAQRRGVEIVGVELSQEGCRTTYERSFIVPTAHVVQADVCRLPFCDDCFDRVYCYGVVHHLPSPGKGQEELIRVLKPGGCGIVYVYEDFSERSVGWRWLLAATNQLRRITPHVPHHAMYLLSYAASPIAYVLFTIPFRLLRSMPAVERLAAGFPYRQAAGPLSLVGDLYDRFSAPIEARYGRTEAIGLMQNVGFQQVAITKDRGWLITGTKVAAPARVPADGDAQPYP